MSHRFATVRLTVPEYRGVQNALLRPEAVYSESGVILTPRATAVSRGGEAKADVRRDGFRDRFAVNGNRCALASLSDAAGFR